MAGDIEYDQQLCVLIGDIYRNWRERIDVLAKKYNLTRTEWQVIGKLECRGSKLAQAELIEFLAIDAAQLTRALNNLEENGYIISTIDKSNRRNRFIELSNQSAKYIKEIKAVNYAINNAIVKNLSTAGHKTLISLLNRLREITGSLIVEK